MTDSRRIFFSRLFYVVGAGLLALLMWLMSMDQPPDPISQKVYEPLEPFRIYVPFLASTLCFVIAIGLSRRGVQIANAPGKVSLSLAGSSLLLIMVGAALVVWWQTSVSIRERNFLDIQHSNRVNDLRCQTARIKCIHRANTAKASSSEERQRAEAEYQRSVATMERLIFDENAEYQRRINRWEERYQIY